ncbi:MAG: pyridoxamine 5'-phosphate oxidase family protein [Labilithrix sp.]|nr:pyridoxamine 5'-phosphate oxidase family protein [Labilithrix sp.]MCW5810374.1 pyridoxamine 5'-phosphate oxidase family protein [Labilithrix sp.]
MVPELGDLFESGVSILVGTRDAALVPEAMRGCGAVVHADRQHVTVFVPTIVAERTLANIRDNGQVAVCFSRQIDHRTMQIKGRVREVREAAAEERDVVMRYHGALTDGLAMIGMQRSTLKPWNAWPATAVEVEVEKIFSQTPGPNAGEPWTGGRT